MTKAALTLILLLWCPQGGHAGGLPVFDSVADAKKTWDMIQRTAAEVRAYGQMIKAYENDVRGVISTGEMVIQGGKQLASMPTNLSVFGLLAHYDSAVNRLTGMVDTGTRTMGTIYGQVSTVATAEGRETLLNDMKTERIRLMQILVAAKVDQSFVTEAQRHARNLAKATTDAEGQKAVAQAMANAQAMQAAHNNQVQAWTEAIAKVELLEKLEQQAIREAQALRAKEEATSWYATKPMTLPEGFNGFMINPTGKR